MVQVGIVIAVRALISVYVYRKLVATNMDIRPHENYVADGCGWNGEPESEAQ